jgi:diketogulonate reductase-like aldo/keto reductase
MALGAQPGAVEPAPWKLVLAIRHVLPAEDAEPQHLFRHQIRREPRREVPADRLGPPVDGAALHPIGDDERQVGEGTRRSGISRDDVFIETKVWIGDYGYDVTLHAFDRSAGKLGVDHLDLLLLHQPLPSRFDLTLDAYRALEKLLAGGKVRAIGVSNFVPEHLQRLLSETSVVPAVNQIEVHPYFQQTALQRLHADQSILTQAWSPIGGITSYGGGERRTFDDRTLMEIERQHGKSAAPVMLRRHLQQVHQAGSHRQELRRLRL